MRGENNLTFKKILLEYGNVTHQRRKTGKVAPN